MMTNLKKVYERPCVEVIPYGDGLMGNAFSEILDGHGGKWKTEGDDNENMAREYDWDDSWDDFDMPNNNGKDYW